jgi:hypothetical protein
MRNSKSATQGGSEKAMDATKNPPPRREGKPMILKKTLPEREKELQLLLATPAGLEELQKLASKYSAASGKLKPPGTSVITYILVHERGQGLIR